VLLDLQTVCAKRLQAGQGCSCKTAEANLHGFSGEEETLRAEIAGLQSGHGGQTQAVRRLAGVTKRSWTASTATSSATKVS
jgi:hypothetical protein